MVEVPLIADGITLSAHDDVVVLRTEITSTSDVAVSARGWFTGGAAVPGIDDSVSGLVLVEVPVNAQTFFAVTDSRDVRLAASSTITTQTGGISMFAPLGTIWIGEDDTPVALNVGAGRLVLNAGVDVRVVEVPLLADGITLVASDDVIVMRTSIISSSDIAMTARGDSHRRPERPRRLRADQRPDPRRRHAHRRHVGGRQRHA